MGSGPGACAYKGPTLGWVLPRHHLDILDIFCSGFTNGLSQSFGECRPLPARPTLYTSGKGSLRKLSNLPEAM